MEQKQILRIFYCGLLAGSSVCFWNKLQDATLLPRIVFAFVWLVGFAPVWFKLFWGKEFKASIPDIFFTAYVLFHALSIAQAINKPEAVYETQKIFMVFVCYLVFKAGLIQKVITESVLLKTVLVVSVAYAVFAVSQLSNLLAVARPEGDNLYNINALAGHKNLYSGFLIVTSCLLSILAINTTKLWRKLAIAVIVLQVAMIVVLQTRSVFLATIIATIILAVGLFKLKQQAGFALLKKAAIPVAGVVLLGIVFFVASGTFSSVIKRLNIANYLNSDTGAERLVLWYKSYYMLCDHWLTGVGARNWTLVNPYYTYKGMFRMMYLNMSFLQPHNDFIWVWCELGILGLISFIGLFVSLLWSANRAAKASKEFSFKLAMLILIAQQVAFMVFSFFDFPKERMEHHILLALSWAFIAYRTQGTGYTFTLNPKAVKVFLAFILVVLVSGVWGTYSRMKADSHMREMLAASERGDQQSVVLLAQEMTTPFSNLTPVAFPKKWYEGVAHYSLKHYDEAYACFIEARKQAPYNPNVLNNLGGMQTFFKQYEDALSTYKETLRINPKNDDARFNVSFTLYQLGRYQEALDSVGKVWSNIPKKESFEKNITAARDSVNNLR
ncbi:MAG TPA: O-antigen ligase family protein [Chitinophagales bacterium]|nr:O-antigen ligase family protein [Chitinophagales bacterium]